MAEQEKAINWADTYNRLNELEKIYRDIGSAGKFALQFVIEPLEKRLLDGERTQQLHDEIMNIAE